MPEFDAITRIAARLGTAPAGELWIGDDAALVHIGGATVVAAADAVVAGVHFDLTLTTIADAGWKAMAVNLSDLAAMGCVATHALVTVSGPGDTDIDGLYDGIEAAALAYGCAVVGGDLTSSPTLSISVFVMGNGTVAPPPVTRRAARVGDHLWVSGGLGASSAGLRALRTGQPGPTSAHARPVPRVLEGTAARDAGATAMIDVSDGFAADLGHLLDASGVGCSLTDVPVVDAATEEEALGGGEDYELVWTAPPDAPVLESFAAHDLRPPIRVGEILADPAVRLLRGEPLRPRGWVHPIG